MPEIRVPSTHKSKASRILRPTKKRLSVPPSLPVAQPQLVRCSLPRRDVYRQLMTIQINTAGLSGPYRTEQITMARVVGNHAAVRELRRMFRQSLLILRSGPLWELLLSSALTLCSGNIGQAARMLGASAQQIRRALDLQKPSKRTPSKH